jgi:D-hydroxyproline dehydrogenase subunit beta
MRLLKSLQKCNDAVVGAGILGLAHAYRLASFGRRVVVFERHPRACSASVRNFGMLWPIGQPFGEMRDLAKRSVGIWLEILAASGLWHERTGSLHLAYHYDEARILEEYARESLANSERVELLDAVQARRLAPAVEPEGLRGALWCQDEVCVDPREVVAGLPGWLSREHGVSFRFDTPIVKVDEHTLIAGDERYSADRIWICCGDELRILYPEMLEGCGLVRCKLQMMRSQPLGEGSRIGPMLAAGLTLRHYAAFRNCPSLRELQERITRDSPWLDRYGIHVMVSQNGQGELTIGDSHEYGDDIEPFDKGDIEEWILDYLKTFLPIAGLRVASRWHGTYVKHPEKPFLILKPSPEVTVITGVGGAGMTLSFGLAEKVVTGELGEFVSS